MSAATEAVESPADATPLSSMRWPNALAMCVNARTPSRSTSRSLTWSSIHARITTP